MNKTNQLTQSNSMLDEQPEIDPCEYTHFDCWGGEQDDDNPTLLDWDNPLAISVANSVLSNWSKSLAIPSIHPDVLRGQESFEHYYLTGGAHAEGYANIFREVFDRVIQDGRFAVYASDNFIEIYKVEELIMKNTLSNKHYSELILDELVTEHGWNYSIPGQSVQKNVGGNTADGMLNPSGTKILFGNFDAPRMRYLALQYGFEEIIDIDCRDRDIKEVAKEFDEFATVYAIETSGMKLPHEMTFAEFSKTASVVMLENHGRKSEVFVGKKSLGFCDFTTEVGSLRQAHSREISNAIYTHLPDAMNVIAKVSFPSEQILNEYPELKDKWSDVLKSRESVTVGTYTGKILAIEGSQVVQKIGRDVSVVARHEISNLSKVPEKGELAEIQYANGKGVVKELSQSIEIN